MSETRTSETVIDGQRLATDCKPHSRYQPRYVAYCVAHGKTPEQMLRADRERWPGGHIAGYVLWIRERWNEWKASKNLRPDHILSDSDHVEFDGWLNTKTVFLEVA